MDADEVVRTRYRADATQLRDNGRPDLPFVMFAATLNELVRQRPFVAAVDAKEQLAARLTHIRVNLSDRCYRAGMATLSAFAQEVEDLIDAAVEEAGNVAAAAGLTVVDELSTLTLYDIFEASEYKAFVVEELHSVAGR